MSSAAVLAAFAGQLAQNVAFDAVVDGDDVKFRALEPPVTLVPLPRRLVPGEALAAAHHGHEIHADQPGPFARLALEHVEVELARGLVRDHRIRHAVGADETGERARIDTGKRDHSARLEPLVEVAGRAVVGRRGDRGVQHRAARPGRRRHADGFDVLFVGADVADMRKGEGDDLAGIGRIGQDLLVAGHRGVEAHLTHGMAGGAEAEAFQHRSVGEHEERRGLRLGPAAIALGRDRLCHVHQSPKSRNAQVAAIAARFLSVRANAKGHSRAARRYQLRPQGCDESAR